MTNNQHYKKQRVEQDLWILELAEEDFKLITRNTFMKCTRRREKETKRWKISTKNWNW